MVFSTIFSAGSSDTPVVNGSSLRLTIVPALQYAAEQAWKHGIVVVAAGGNTGSDGVAKSEPDGHTLLFTAPGPLVDAAGRVIAINTAASTDAAGLGFAMEYRPIDRHTTTIFGK